MAIMTDVEVDLDQPPTPEPPTSWLDHPSRVVAGIAGVGVLAIAVVALTAPSWRGTPAPAAAPPPAAARACLAGTAPLPAFTITLATKGDIPTYQDTGRWVWQQMLSIPAAFEGEAGLEVLELQTGSAAMPRITVATGGSGLLSVRVHDAASRVVQERAVQFAAAAAYDQWVTLRLTSEEMADGDVLTVAVVDAAGAITSQALAVGTSFHAPLTGFGILAPMGHAPTVSGPEPEVKYGPPTFTTEAC